MTQENLRKKGFDALCKELDKEELSEGVPHTTFVDGYVIGATEQDRIARQEERERCVKAAQDAHCGICGDIDCILVDKSDNERRMKCNQLRCIRKSIEKGGNHGTES